MPAYEPDKWNKQPIQGGTNCYDYAADQRSDLKRGGSQPGRASGDKVTAPVSCRSVNDGAVADGFKKSTKSDLCDFNCWKVALVVDRRGRDYHWYRQDPTGNWSHKRGAGPVHAHDADGHAITDPERAARDYGRYNYSIFCGYYCVCPGSFVIASVQPEGGEDETDPHHALAASQAGDALVVRLKEAAVLANAGMEVHLPPGLIRISYEAAGEGDRQEGAMAAEISTDSESSDGPIVQAMIRSGLPDPIWQVSARDMLIEYVDAALAMPEVPAFEADLPGFLIHDLSVRYRQVYVGGDGVIVSCADGVDLYRAPSGQFLDWLLSAAASHAEADDILGSFEA